MCYCTYNYIIYCNSDIRCNVKLYIGQTLSISINLKRENNTYFVLHHVANEMVHVAERNIVVIGWWL